MKITDDIFKSIFNEGVWISITNSLKFVPKGPGGGGGGGGGGGVWYTERKIVGGEGIYRN